jgi:hypothetical protein
MYRGLLLLPHHDSKIFPCEGSHSHENISPTKVGNVCLSPLPSQKKKKKRKNKMSTHLFFRENTLCLFGIRARAYSFCSEKERRLGQPACQEGKAVPQFLTSRFRSDTKVTQM